MDVTLWFKTLFAFAFVIGLMLLCSYVLRKYGAGGAAFIAGGKKRLSVVEFQQIDHKRRLVLVRRDDKEHLLVLGPEGETVVETGIIPPQTNIVELPVKEQKNA